MTTLIVCLLVAIILCYLSKLPMMSAIKKEARYDNNHPRVQQSQLTGYAARALAAHQNSFEALIVFSTAVLAAMATNHVTKSVEYMAIAFIIIRIVYHVLYLLDKASLRSLVWSLGLFTSIGILCSCFY